MKNIIKTTLIICGMAFLFASCSEYKVLETTEVFKIEKTSSEVHVYLRNGYAVRIDPNDRWDHYFINENRERVKFYDPEVLLWQNAEPGWVVEVYGEYQNDYLRLVPPADITEELEVASISVYEGETGRFLGYLSGGLLTSPSGKFDFQSYQGKILTNVTFTNGKFISVNPMVEPFWLEVKKGAVVKHERVNGISLYSPVCK
mgnify:FL=1